MIKKKKAAPAVPADLDGMLSKAFRYSVIAKQYQVLADASRSDVQRYLEHTDEMDVEAGKGFKHSLGTVIYSNRENYRVDTDKIIELVKSGAISIESIVNLAFPEGRVARVEPLKIALGSKFDGIATVTTSSYITLRPASEFRGTISNEFRELTEIMSEATQSVMTEAIQQSVTTSPPKSLEELLL